MNSILTWKLAKLESEREIIQVETSIFLIPSLGPLYNVIKTALLGWDITALMMLSSLIMKCLQEYSQALKVPRTPWDATIYWYSLVGIQQFPGSIPDMTSSASMITWSASCKIRTRLQQNISLPVNGIEPYWDLLEFRLENCENPATAL